MNMENEKLTVSEDRVNPTEVVFNIDQLFIETCDKMFNLVSLSGLPGVNLGGRYVINSNFELVKIIPKNQLIPAHPILLAKMVDGEVIKAKSLSAYDEISFLEHYINNDCENMIINDCSDLSKDYNDLNDRYVRVLSKKRGK